MSVSISETDHAQTGGDGAADQKLEPRAPAGFLGESSKAVR